MTGSNVLLHRDTILDILDAIISWYSGAFNEKGRSVIVSEETDCGFSLAVNKSIQTLMSIHQDIQAEYTEEMKTILHNVTHRDASIDLISDIQADVISMLISYYGSGETYEMLSKRFNIPIYECIVKICTGERMLFERFETIFN